MSKLAALAKLLGISEDAAKGVSKQAVDVLSAIDTPEKAAKLSGKNRATYLKALDEVYGDSSKRSADMGFGPETWYHGTSADIKEFDPSFGGASTKSKDATKGTFFSSSPKTASTYADMASEAGITEHIPEIKRLQDKLSTIPDDAVRERDAVFNEISRLRSEAYELTREKLPTPMYMDDGTFESFLMNHPSRQNIIPARLKMKDPLVSDEMGRYWDEKRTSNLIDKANTKNKDGLILRNSVDDAVTDIENLNTAAPSDIAVVTDPSQIRSKFAAFDPRFAKSGSLVAGAAAVPFSKDNKNKKTSSGRDMTIAQLKAYLENPSIALDNLMRSAPSEGDKIESARNSLLLGEDREPTEKEIQDQVAMMQNAMDSAEGFVGGGVALAKKMPGLRGLLKGKATKDSLNKPGVEIPEGFGSREDIIKRVNAEANKPTVPMTEADAQNMWSNDWQRKIAGKNGDDVRTDITQIVEPRASNVPGQLEDTDVVLERLKKAIEEYRKP